MKKDTILPTRDSVTAVLTVVMAVLMMSAPAVAAGAGGGTPLALGVDLGSPDAPDDVIRYGSDAKPGVMVSVESSEDIANLQKWANDTDSEVRQTYNGSNAVLIAASPEDIRAPWTSLDTWVGGESTITTLGYVTGWTWDLRVDRTEPLGNLETSESYEKPTGAWYAEATSSGSFSAGMMAYDGDAPDSNMTHVRGLTDADDVSATGEGVDVAVIDSGTNFGNGSLYGNGSAGSDMRVTDAYDYVDDEEPDLTVNRSDLPAELEKMEDPNGHGSWVSSAVLNAQNGIAPDANLMAYRALNSEGSGSTSDIRAAIERANREGADIIVMSLGSPTWSEGMADSLRYALSEDGNVTGAFVAVGNSYTTTRYVSSPADVDGVIGVTATNAVRANETQKAYFANIGPDPGLDGSNRETRGETPDTAAPGMAIAAPTFTAPKADGGRVTDTRLSGTSMANPIAAGVGALLLDANPGLEGDRTAFRERIVNSGSHTPRLGVTQSRGGTVNASRAINGWSGADAPDRDLPDKTMSWDSLNRALAGDVGVKVNALGDWMSTAL